MSKRISFKPSIMKLLPSVSYSFVHWEILLKYPWKGSRSRVFFWGGGPEPQKLISWRMLNIIFKALIYKSELCRILQLGNQFFFFFCLTVLVYFRLHSTNLLSVHALNAAAISSLLLKIPNPKTGRPG